MYDKKMPLQESESGGGAGDGGGCAVVMMMKKVVVMMRKRVETMFEIGGLERETRKKKMYVYIYKDDRTLIHVITSWI